MKIQKRLYLPAAFLLMFFYTVNGQTYFKVDADSVRIINGELVIRNQSRDIKGTLINIGNGVTEFQKLKLANNGDSALSIIGQDTLQLDNPASHNYHVLSRDISIKPGYYYHPLAFEASIEAGKAYHVHALIYLETTLDFDQISLFKVEYSDTVYKEKAKLRNTFETETGIKRYSLEYDKLIRSDKQNDTFNLSFSTEINDMSEMKLGAMSYMEIEEITFENVGLK